MVIYRLIGYADNKINEWRRDLNNKILHKCQHEFSALTVNMQCAHRSGIKLFRQKKRYLALKSRRGLCTNFV